MNNYPPGVTDADPHFNPPACINCGQVVVLGEDCEECGAYAMTDEDYAAEAGDRAYDREREHRG